MTQVGLGTTQTNNDRFKIEYSYGELNTDGTVDAAKNIGNIAKTTTTIPSLSFVQTFKYDSINRLSEATEKTGTTENWKQTFGYDRFGNRTSFYQIVGSTELPTNNLTKPTVDPANNKFTTGQGYVYDLNGNLVQDAQGRSFTFNGDDKQTEVSHQQSAVCAGSSVGVNAPRSVYLHRWSSWDCHGLRLLSRCEARNFSTGPCGSRAAMCSE